MNRILLLFVGILINTCIYASQTDRFTKLEDAIGKKVVFYSATSQFDSNGAFVYLYAKGKVKAIKDRQWYETAFGADVDLYVSSIETIKKKTYLVLEAPDTRYYLRIDSKHNYLGNLRSIDYWEGVLNNLKETCKYRHIKTMPQKDHPCTYNKLIEWTGVKMPSTLYSDVRFCLIEHTINESGTIITSSKESTIDAKLVLENRTKYLTQEDYDILLWNYQIQKERERRDEERDTIPTVANVIHNSYSKDVLDDAGITYDRATNYKVSLYFAGEEEKQYGSRTMYFSGYCLGSEVKFRKQDLRFKDNSDIDFLIRRGTHGLTARRATAKDNDEKYLNHYSDSVSKETLRTLDNLLAISNFYSKKKIFITNQRLTYSDYGRLGVDFTFYNCYDKTIKYIEIKMVPYNCVDDIQRDEIGVTTKEVRCIGPIEPQDTANYTFEKIWWDSRDVIDYIKTTRIKIIFTDNTSVIYNSSSQIDLHRSSHYSVEEIGLK